MLSKDQKPSPSLYGGILLVAGNCIGAAMLALPVKTGDAGFFLSLLAFLFIWSFMTLTALMLAEVCNHLKKGNSLISMAAFTLGEKARWLTWLVYLSLFYALMVAYSYQSGLLISKQLSLSTSLQVSSSLCGALCVLLLMFVVSLGTQAVDGLNRFLMLGLFLCYFFLIFTGFEYIRPELWFSHFSLKPFFLSFPVVVTSFGFHNVIPSLCQYYHYERKKVRTVILWGSLLPFFVYLIWNAVILGIIPFSQENSAYHFLKDSTPTEALTLITGAQGVFTFANAFAFFAVITSFVGMGLGLVDFLSDGLKLAKKGLYHVTLCSLAFIPPFLLSLFWKNLFLKSLEYAGGFLAIVIFGFLPPLMLKSLKKKKERGIYSQVAYCLALGGSLLIFSIQFLWELGVIH